MNKLFLTSACLMGLALPAFAIPGLQLDIGGGTWQAAAPGHDGETTIAGGPSFSLYALLNPDANNPLNGSYKLSVALYPVTGVTASSDLGKISFDGTEYDVVDQMTYGVPPIATVTSSDGNDDLPKHGIYPTYFIEVSVPSFTGAPQSADYNAQSDATNGDPTTHPGTGLYYWTFAVDLSLLDSRYGMHFDLYQMDGNDIISSAPFSKDAEGSGDRNTGSSVPDGGSTVALLGLGLAGLSVMARRRV